jgi:MFS family permease
MRLPRHLIILALLTAAGLSLALMQTLVVPALPSFQREFGTTPTWTAWIVTGFLLSSSILTPIIGKLGDAYGKKRLLVISLALFGLGSLGAAAAWSLGSLVVFRVVQGAGAALFPLSFGIIRDEFPPEKVAVGIGTVSSVFGLGGGVGLVLSGVILEELSWRWLFVIGSMPVLAAIVLIAPYVPESRVKTPARPDYLGSAVLSLALGALLVAVSEGTPWGWGSAGVLGLLVASAVLFAAWIRIERSCRSR